VAHWVGAQGLVNSTTKAKTCLHYDITRRKPHTRNKKKFFQFELEDLLNL